MGTEWTMFCASIADVAPLSCERKVSGASHGSRPQTWWWRPKIRATAKLKEFCRAMLAHRTHQTVDGYQQAKQVAARAVQVLLGLGGVWGSHGERLFLNLKQIPTKCQCIRRGKHCSANTLCNSGVTPSTEEVKAGHSEEDSAKLKTVV